MEPRVRPREFGLLCEATGERLPTRYAKLLRSRLVERPFVQIFGLLHCGISVVLTALFTSARGLGRVKTQAVVARIECIAKIKAYESRIML
jgi:hypothetical protein